MTHGDQEIRLDPLQLAWLQELGIERRLLQRYAVTPTPATPVQVPMAPAALAPAVHGAGGAPLAADGMSSGQAVAASAAAAQVVAARPGMGASGSGAAGRSAARDLLKVLRGGRPGAEVSVVQPDAQDLAPGTTDLPAVLPLAQVDLQGLATTVLACQACALHGDRARAVPGDGAEVAPDWLVIGEAPGAADERAGVPFQGRAGDLLRAMLAAAGVNPGAQVFFTNAVKCRPLSNRPPAADEISQCLPYLQRQIALLRPARILALGRVAAAALLGQDQDIEALRGKVWHHAAETGNGIPVVVTYHPGWLLAHPQQKAGAWRDLMLARQSLAQLVAD